MLGSIFKWFAEPSAENVAPSVVTLSEYLDKTALHVANAHKMRGEHSPMLTDPVSVSHRILKQGFLLAQNQSVSYEEGILKSCDNFRSEYDILPERGVMMRPGEADKILFRGMEIL